MSKETFGINDGHTKSGYGTGAVGIIKESEHTRLVGEAVRRRLKERGQNVINCTIDYARSTNESLALIVAQANRQELDWFISIHFNAGGGRGVEVYTYKGRQYPDAVDVCKNISALGFENRGVKAGTGLYVIRKTKAKSMLIEVCFVDTADAYHYLNVGHEAVAEAIVNALVEYVAPPKPVEENPIFYGVVTASALNIRDGAGTGYRILGTLKNGTRVKIDKRYSQGDWYSIYYGDHGGFVHKNYIRVI